MGYLGCLGSQEGSRPGDDAGRGGAGCHWEYAGGTETVAEAEALGCGEK